MTFDIASDDDMFRTFLNIISLGSKDNTYKFAMARFLLDYCNEYESCVHTCVRVDFDTISKYFLRYYWPQICKLKMKHAPQVRKKPEIIKIIEEEFPKSYYPQSFKEICVDEPEKIQNCIEKITKKCFHNVIWRFQRIKVNKAVESKLFFKYTISRVKNSNRKYVDLSRGIVLNPEAIKFFKKYYPVLLKALICEWARFLEKLNVGLPKIINKTEGLDSKRKNLSKYRRILYHHDESVLSELQNRTNLSKYRCILHPFKSCFYCNIPLEEIKHAEVEHVIPFDYIAEDNIWNLTLVCKKCNCKKLGALPPVKYIIMLIKRNKDYRNKISNIQKSLERLDDDVEDVIKKHYENAKSHGYMVLEDGFWRCKPTLP